MICFFSAIHIKVTTMVTFLLLCWYWWYHYHHIWHSEWLIIDAALARQRKMDVQIQECFLRFMAYLLKGYRSYLLPVSEATMNGDFDISKLFDVPGNLMIGLVVVTITVGMPKVTVITYNLLNILNYFVKMKLLSSFASPFRPLHPSHDMLIIIVTLSSEAFLKSHDKSYQRFLSEMLRTQYFCHFLEGRSLGTKDDAGLSFFDDCLQKLSSNSSEPLVEVEEKLLRCLFN